MAGGFRSLSEALWHSRWRADGHTRFGARVLVALAFLQLQRAPTMVAHAKPSSEPSCDLDVLDAQLPTAAQQFAKHYRNEKPVIILGLTKAWPASSWSRSEWEEQLAETHLPLRNYHLAGRFGGFYNYSSISGAEYFSSVLGTDQPLMIFSTSRRETVVPELVAKGAMEIPEMLRDINLDPVLSIGGPDDGIAYHNHGETWLALLQGAKRWFLQEPSRIPKSEGSRRNMSEVEAEGTHVINCEQHSSEVLYLPRGWHHATYNIGNFVIGVGGQDNAEGILAAAVRGDVKEIKTLWDNGASLHQKDELGRQPMILAAHGGHVATMEWLVQRKAKLGCRDNFMQEPIHLAAYFGHESVVDWLLTKRVDPNGRRKSSTTRRPMDNAIRSNFIAVVELLLQRRANIHFKDSAGGVAAHAGAESGHIDMLELLLSHRAQLDAQNSDMDQPIHLAASWRHTDVIKWLVSQGVDAYARNGQGYTPIVYGVGNGDMPLLEAYFGGPFSAPPGQQHEHLDDGILQAASQGHIDVVRWLASKGAKLTSEGGSVAQVAEESGHPAIAKLARRLQSGHSRKKAALKEL